MVDLVKKYTFLVSEELDVRFRQAVFASKGMYRGNITEALEEAMELWINKQKSSTKEA